MNSLGLDMLLLFNEINKAIQIFIIADIITINKYKGKLQGLYQFVENHSIYELPHCVIYHTNCYTIIKNV